DSPESFNTIRLYFGRALREDEFVARWMAVFFAAMTLRGAVAKTDGIVANNRRATKETRRLREAELSCPLAWTWSPANYKVAAALRTAIGCVGCNLISASDSRERNTRNDDPYTVHKHRWPRLVPSIVGKQTEAADGVRKLIDAAFGAPVSIRNEPV